VQEIIIANHLVKAVNHLVKVVNRLVRVANHLKVMKNQKIRLFLLILEIKAAHKIILIIVLIYRMKIKNHLYLKSEHNLLKRNQVVNHQV